MGTRAKANVVILLLLGAFATPALAGAYSGGASLGSTGRSGSNPTGAQPGDLTDTVSGDGITLSARVSTLLRNQLRFTGSIPASGAGDTVVIERLLSRQADWVPTATGIAARDGAFTAVWRTNHIGRFAIRVILRAGRRGGPRLAGVSPIAGASPTLNVTVYRPAIATIFGTGFYGQRTACGETLRPSMVGVAHRWLPCGTRVAIYFDGRTMVVPVIDRGPYANNADWDVTEAAARMLRMGGTETIGAVSLRAAP